VSEFAYGTVVEYLKRRYMIVDRAPTLFAGATRYHAVALDYDMPVPTYTNRPWLIGGKGPIIEVRYAAEFRGGTYVPESIP
jgi:hypothetical protein